MRVYKGIWINKRVVKGGHLSSKGRGYIFMMSGEGGSPQQ